MTLLILISLAAGLTAGYVNPALENIFGAGLINSALALLLFVIGFTLAQSGSMRQSVKRLPAIAWALPFLIAFGSVAAAAAISPFLNLKPLSGALVGAGFGWYSLAAVIIAPYDLTLGALALLTNVFREVLALILTPFVARKLGYLPAVAPGGATAMDVTLPVISKATDPETTLAALFSGTVLSSAIPLLLPLLCRLLLR
ncbi:MAG TPA: lysine exporter LysO family protein [Firmicutes bacterium]|nr:lysine exporter LysO family protein [Bacillota bacterium]